MFFLLFRLAVFLLLSTLLISIHMGLLFYLHAILHGDKDALSSYLCCFFLQLHSSAGQCKGLKWKYWILMFNCFDPQSSYTAHHQALLKWVLFCIELALFCRAVTHLWGRTPKQILLHEVVPPQEQKSALLLVELHELPVRPFLHGPLGWQNDPLACLPFPPVLCCLQTGWGYILCLCPGH